MGVPRVLAAAMRRGVYAAGTVGKRMFWVGTVTYGMTLVVSGKKAI